MLDLTLGYVIQQAREREVTDDLRNRQALRTPDAGWTGDQAGVDVEATSRQPVHPRRSPIRARGTSA